MKNYKTALVLEGGGMRGAYSAGALSWLVDNDIEFDNSYGISTGAVYLCNYLLKNKKNLFEFSTKYINDPSAIGVRSILRCAHLVDYDYLFNKLMIEVCKFDMNELKKVKTEGKIGVYELSTGEPEYHRVQEITVEELKAACTLPFLGKIARIGERKMLDAGIRDMIPIEQAIKDGCDRFLIITTKPEGYVRKPSKKFVVDAMKLRYKSCPNIASDYSIRDKNYYKQLDMITKEVENGRASYVFPTKKSSVSRLGGSKEALEELFNLGYSDMEARKEEIFALVGKD